MKGETLLPLRPSRPSREEPLPEMPCVRNKSRKSEHHAKAAEDAKETTEMERRWNKEILRRDTVNVSDLEPRWFEDREKESARRKACSRYLSKLLRRGWIKISFAGHSYPVVKPENDYEKAPGMEFNFLVADPKHETKLRPIRGEGK